ncbi:ABC transporter ATP-binding protein [Luteimonas sp. RD2P54]|uniref:ABC transporter ATP-binding protein n=1 Tax=Luteimonas endophytica TaxID=3042023 RepID=A0ABT6J4I9_9GAMM|nr:ABC transporter ATP-binding protein [Luteimonas endophytica]MDH5821732.1 ABC transporter ATP-binding protein [Luteimonas endophytica]
MLEVVGLHKSYQTPQGPLPVLQGVDLRLERGGSLALMGESGSGKSTLLHLVAGLDSADSGRIHADGKALHAMGEPELAEWRRCGIGLIFQQFNLVGSLTVADNLAFQARLAGRHDLAWQARLIERLGLGDVLHRYPEQLSGGQQQRVALGRALAARPALVLADEPTGNLDEATAEQVLQLLLELVAGSGSTLLMVTHSPQVAARLQRTVVLRKGRVHPGPGAPA